MDQKSSQEYMGAYLLRSHSREDLYLWCIIRSHNIKSDTLDGTEHLYTTKHTNIKSDGSPGRTYDSSERGSFLSTILQINQKDHSVKKRQRALTETRMALSLWKTGRQYPLRYSFPENPMDTGVWRAAVHGVTKSQTQLKQLSSHTNTSK